jgi:hypothetical protein
VTTSLYQATYEATYPGFTTYPYYGHLTLYYLDYLDLVTQQTLVAAPGGSYAMTPVNSRAGLTVPPPDGRWVSAGFGPLFLRPRFSLALAPAQLAEPSPPPTLHEVRAALERSRVASGWHERHLRVPAQPRARLTGPVTPPPVPQPSQMQATRAQLETARVAHGHYAPGGCKLCMSGGQAA